MIKFSRDLIKILSYFFKFKTPYYIFFCENNNILKYLISYIKLKSTKKKRLLVFSFEKINLSENISSFYLETNFFRQLFFLTLKCKFLFTSTPDLNNSLFQKTLFDKSKYIYLQHSNISLINAYNENAFKAFDAIQSINTYQYKDIYKLNIKFKTKIKVFRSKYKFLEILNKKKNQDEIGIYDVLIAPSWNTEFFKDNFYLNVINELKKNDISYKIRPHYMSFKKGEISYKQLKFHKINLDDNEILNLKSSKVLISDWSGIFIEYMLVNKKKPYLFNTKMKVLNHNNFIEKKEAIEIKERGNFGKIYDNDQIDKMIFEIKKDLIDPNYNLINSESDLSSKIKTIFYL